MANKKKDKQFFILAGIDWSDDASIDAGTAAIWGIMNAQREEKMNKEEIKVKEPTIKLTGKYTQAFTYAKVRQNCSSEYRINRKRVIESHRVFFVMKINL